MRDSSVPQFRKDTYEADLLEFTKKSLKEWRETFDSLGQVHDKVSILTDKLYNTSHEEIIESHKDTFWMSEPYVRGYIADSQANIERLKELNFKVTEDFLGREKKYALDHGCRDGTYAWPLWIQGYHVTFVDLPLEYFKFMEWRAKKYKVPDLDFVYVDKPLDYLDNRMFDLIWSHDTLEHCIHSHIVLAYLSDHLKIGGLFHLTVGFGEEEHGPCKPKSKRHLIRNYELFGLEIKDSILVERGFGNYRWKQCIVDAGLDVYEKSTFFDNRDPKNIKISDKPVGTEAHPIFFIKKRDVDWRKFEFT